MGLVLLGVSVLTFFIAHVVPADPVLAALGEHAREDQIRSYRHAYGLDRPVGVQYLIYVHRLLAGDFGISIRTRRPVAEDLGEFLPATVELGGTARLEVLYQDYIRTARAKGLAGARVVLRHALRNAMIPTLTIVGISFGNLLSGAVLTETVFAWPGLGRYATTSAISLDFPAVMGVTIVAAVIYTTINLAIDLLYARLDPRVRYE